MLIYKLASTNQNVGIIKLAHGLRYGHNSEIGQIPV